MKWIINNLKGRFFLNGKNRLTVSSLFFGILRNQSENIRKKREKINFLIIVMQNTGDIVNGGLYEGRTAPIHRKWR